MTRTKKLLIYKICCAAFAVLLLITPHRGIPETEIRVLATVLGIDCGGDKVCVSAQLAVPVSPTGGGKASTVAKSSGGSMAEALENLEIGIGRRIDYSHLATIAFGGKIETDDIITHLGYMLSSDKAGPGVYVVYCNGSTAGDFIEQAQNMGESSDAEIANFISYSKSGNHVSTTGIIEVFHGLNSPSHATYLACIALEDSGNIGVGKSEEESESGSGGKSSGGENGKQSSGSGKQSGDSEGSSADSEKSGGEKEGSRQGNSGGGSGESGSSQDSSSTGGSSGGGGEGKSSNSGSSGEGGENGSQGGEQEGGSSQSGGPEKKLVAANSIAVLDGKTHEVTVLNPLVTRGVVWQDPKSDYGLMELRNAMIDGEEIPSVPARITYKRVRRVAKVINGENVLTYKVKAKIRLDDLQVLGKRVRDKEIKKTIEQQFETLISTSIGLAVTESKESGVDFLGIKDTFYRFCGKGFKNFDLKSVIVKVQASVILQT